MVKKTVGLPWTGKGDATAGCFDAVDVEVHQVVRRVVDNGEHHPSFGLREAVGGDSCRRRRGRVGTGTAEIPEAGARPGGLPVVQRLRVLEVTVFGQHIRGLRAGAQACAG